jgi:hypothetical protein
MSASQNERRAERYATGKRAEAEVLRRLTKALDRINVASQGNNPAQFLHAMHYLQRGWTGSFSPENDSRSVPRDAPAFTLADTATEALALALDNMFQLAKNAKYSVEESDR